jgi:hypothetical protein
MNWKSKKLSEKELESFLTKARQFFDTEYPGLIEEALKKADEKDEKKSSNQATAAQIAADKEARPLKYRAPSGPLSPQEEAAFKARRRALLERRDAELREKYGMAPKAESEQNYERRRKAQVGAYGGAFRSVKGGHRADSIDRDRFHQGTGPGRIAGDEKDLEKEPNRWDIASRQNIPKKPQSNVVITRSSKGDRVTMKPKEEEVPQKKTPEEQKQSAKEAFVNQLMNESIRRRRGY